MKLGRNEIPAMVLWFAFAITSRGVFAQDPNPTELKSSGRDENRVYEVGSRTRVKIGGVSVGASYARFSSSLLL